MLPKQGHAYYCHCHCCNLWSAEQVAFGEAREEPEYFEFFCEKATMALFVSALRLGPAVQTQVMRVEEREGLYFAFVRRDKGKKGARTPAGHSTVVAPLWLFRGPPVVTSYKGSSHLSPSLACPMNAHWVRQLRTCQHFI